MVTVARLICTLGQPKNTGHKIIKDLSNYIYIYIYINYMDIGHVPFFGNFWSIRGIIAVQTRTIAL